METPSEVFYADATLAPRAAIPLPDEHEDRGVYVLSGEVTVADQTFPAGQMLVFRPGDRVSLKAGEEGARIMLLGGATMDGPRHIWWNFVSSSKERIEKAKADWKERREGVRKRFNLDWGPKVYVYGPDGAPIIGERSKGDEGYRYLRIGHGCHQPLQPIVAHGLRILRQVNKEIAVGTEPPKNASAKQLRAGNSM